MRITAEEKDATRRRILDAAVQLFRTRGFEATTTRDIADAAGIATGTLFNYFRDQRGHRHFPGRGSACQSTCRISRISPPTLGWKKSCSPSSRRSCGSSSRCANSLRRCWRRRSRRSRPLIDRNPSIRCASTTLRPSPSSLASTDRAELSPVALQVYWTLVHRRAGVLGRRQITQTRRHARFARPVAGDVCRLAAQRAAQDPIVKGVPMATVVSELIAALPEELREDEPSAAADLRGPLSRASMSRCRSAGFAA